MTSHQNPNTPDRIDILIDQVGHFTEGLTELKLSVQAQAEIAQKQLEAINKQGERIDQLAKTVQQQSHSIDRIAAAMEATNHSQSEAINCLTGIIDRLLPPQS